MGEQFRQILVTVFQRADRPSERPVGVIGGLRDRSCVDGVAHDLAHLLVDEDGFVRIVERQHHLVEADAGIRTDAARCVERFGGVGAERQRHADFAAFHGAGQRAFGGVIV